MSRLPLFAAPLLVASLALAPALSGCIRASEARSKRTTPAAPAVPGVHVTTAVVAERTLPRTLVLTGTLIANRKSDVAADATGKVSATYVERGSWVSKGEALARLDGSRAMLAQEEAQAQLAAAEAQSTLAQRDCERAERLFSAGAIHQAEYDRMRTSCKATGWSTTAAAARGRLAQRAVSDAVLRAPFAGLVAERFITEGEYVRPESKVATVLEIDPLRLELSVPESAVAAVAGAAAVDFQVSAFPGQTFRGQVRYLGPAVRRASRDLVVEAVIPNKDRRLRPGMFATAQLTVGDMRAAVVPAQAVRDQAGEARLFVVSGAGRLEERLVQVGPREGGEVVVLAGVRAGETVASPASPALRDGLQVQ
jgi:membrane fusion protein (multidrug efflux system)